MAFKPEDGSGLADSNSYAGLEAANGYWADRGGWEGTDDAKKSALVLATDYIEVVYASKWRGERLTDGQALSWPRDGFDGVPRQLVQAVCVLAKEVLGGSDLLQPQDRAVKREKIDILEVEYMDDAAPAIQRPAIDGLLLATGWLMATTARGPSNGILARR